MKHGDLALAFIKQRGRGYIVLDISSPLPPLRAFTSTTPPPPPPHPPPPPPPPPPDGSTRWRADPLEGSREQATIAPRYHEEEHLPDVFNVIVFLVLYKPTQFHSGPVNQPLYPHAFSIPYCCSQPVICNVLVLILKTYFLTVIQCRPT